MESTFPTGFFALPNYLPAPAPHTHTPLLQMSLSALEELALQPQFLPKPTFTTIHLRIPEHL